MLIGVSVFYGIYSRFRLPPFKEVIVGEVTMFDYLTEGRDEENVISFSNLVDALIECRLDRQEEQEVKENDSE